MHPSSIKNSNEFKILVNNWENNLENPEIFNEICSINWTFLNQSKEHEVGDIIESFSSLLITLSLTPNILKIADIIIIILKAVYNDDAIINQKPLIFILWALYNSNPTIREPLETAIKHHFPYSLVDENVLINYIKFLLDLTTPKIDNKHCDLFIDNMRQFILTEIVKLILDLDSRLIKSHLKKDPLCRAIDTNQSISKLDLVLCLLFDWMNKICFIGCELNWPAALSLYKCIRHVYIKLLLPINMANSVFHSHNIIAYITSFHENLSKNFCEYLWTITLDVKQPITIRSLSSVNLCAFIAKFNFVKVDFLIDFLTNIFSWCNLYADDFIDFESSSEAHSVFFNLSNGGLYALLHRHKEIIDHVGSIDKLKFYGYKWQLSLLTQHQSVVLKFYPFRDQLGELAEFLKRYYFGYIDNIVQDKVLSKKAKETKLASMPFRYFFLPESIKYFVSLRVPNQKFEIKDE